MECKCNFLQENEDKFLVVASLSDSHVDNSLAHDKAKHRYIRVNRSVSLIKNQNYLLELMVFNVDGTLYFFGKVFCLLQ